MSFLFDDTYYRVGKNGVSPFQNMHFHLCPIENACRRDDIHEGRIFITNQFKQHNLKKLEP